MTRRIIYILLGSLLLLALIFGVWFWFFGHGTPTPQNLGTFGSGGPQSGGGTGATQGGNGQIPIGSNAGTGVKTGGSTGRPSGGSGGGTVTTGGGYVQPSPNVEVTPEVVWNNSFGGVNAVFNPTPIEPIKGGDISGNPFLTQAIGPDGKPVNPFGGLLTLLLGCISQYGLTHLAVKASPAVATDQLTELLSVNAFDKSTDASTQGNAIAQCLVRTLGKMAIQMITNSIVSWINSGFNGKPAFVQDFSKFFTDIADKAAASFLKSSNFSLLCSPFQQQVKVAIAQSYARRASVNTPSCTFDQAGGNMGSFINGDFSKGGWNALISLISQPNNNPFGAFMTLQGGLQNSISRAQASGNMEVTAGQGFLSVKKCDPPNSTNCQIETPGAAINDSLQATFQSNLDSLQLAESIDQVLAALVNALITKVLYGGLSNVGKNSNNSTNTPNPAQTAADALMNEMRSSVGSAQQYAQTEQNIILDIQSAQKNLTALLDCWLQASSSPTLSSSKVATARANGDATAAKVYELEAYVTLHNQRILQTNTSIAAVQQLQTNLLLAATPDDVTRTKKQWQDMQTTDNPHIYSAADITAVGQDRTTLQGNLTNINTDTSAKLAQCYAFGQ